MGNMADTFQKDDPAAAAAAGADAASAGGAPPVVDILKQRQTQFRRMESVHRSEDEQSDLLERQKVEEKGMDEVDSRTPDRAKFLHRSVSKGVDENPEADRFDRHIKWLVENGAEFPRLYLRRYADDMRGVHTREEIPPYERIVRIPLKCLVMDDAGTRTAIGKKVRESGVPLTAPNHCMVIIFMLTDMESGDSFYQSYYDILPREFDNFPIFWGEEEMGWLEGSPLVQQINDRKRNIRSDYDQLCKAAPEFARFSYDTFLWCRTAVGSRNFGITVNGGKRTAMVPFADMLNHYRPRETSWTFDNALQGFTMTSLSTLKPGQQVMDSYGKKCNSKFLMHYGFTVEVNREEDGRCMNELAVVLRLRDDTTDPLRSQRLRFLGAGRYQRRFIMTMTYDAKATAEMLSYMRAASCSGEELAELTASGRNGFNLTSYPVRPLSLESEVAALTLLGEALQGLLDGYPTTYEEDKTMLAEGDLTPFSSRRHALIVVMGEKEIAHFYLRLRDIMAELLAMGTWEERMGAMAEQYGGTDDVGRYVTNTVTILHNRARFTQ